MSLSDVCNLAIFAVSGATLAGDFTLLTSTRGQESSKAVFGAAIGTRLHCQQQTAMPLSLSNIHSAAAGSVCYTIAAHRFWRYVFSVTCSEGSHLILNWIAEGICVGSHLMPLLSAVVTRRNILALWRRPMQEKLLAIRDDTVWSDMRGWQLLLLGPVLGGVGGAVYWLFFRIPYVLFLVFIRLFF